MQSELLLGLHNSAKKCTVSISIQAIEFFSKSARHKCKLNYQPHGIENFSYLASSLEVCGNISENKIVPINTVQLTFQCFAPKPEVRKMGGNFRLQKWINQAL